MKQDRRFKPDYGNTLTLLDFLCGLCRLFTTIVIAPIFYGMVTIGIFVDLIGWLAYFIVPVCIIAIVYWLLTML